MKKIHEERALDNRAGEMEIFVEAARLRSFAAAASSLELSPSAVSKAVTRLEKRLGIRLMTRSTRTLQLTAEGELYFRQAMRILADIDETERLVVSGGGAAPRGRLRVSATVAFGTHFVVPLIPDFLARYPEVTLDLSLGDDVIDLLGERTDVAIRAGQLRDSGLKARKLLEMPRVIVASPSYIERKGEPLLPPELARHNCLGYNFSQTMHLWPFRDRESGERIEVAVAGNLEANNGATVRQLACAGLGVARIGKFHVRDDLESGRLISLLGEWDSGDLEPVHAVFPGHAHLASRIRAFIDFLVERIAERVI